jgi:hypothetical protein
VVTYSNVQDGPQAVALSGRSLADERGGNSPDLPSAAHVLRPAWLQRADDRVQLTGLYLSLDEQHLTAEHEDVWVIHPEFLPGRNINKDIALIRVAASIPEDVVYEGRCLRLCQCMPCAGDVMEWVGFQESLTKVHSDGGDS